MQAMNHLTAQAMVSVSHELLTTNRAQIETKAVLHVPLKFIEDAHTKLVTLQKQLGQSTQAVRQLTDHLTLADARHDRKARGVHSALSAWTDLADDNLSQQATDALHTLFPLGLAVTQRSYREQAGTALQVRALLTPQIRTLLSDCNFGTHGLLDETMDWLDTAQHIGEMQAERTRLVGDNDDEAVSQADLRDARFEWIRAMKLFIDILDFTDFDADTRRRLLADLRDAQIRGIKTADSTKTVDEPVVDSEEAPQ